VFEIGPLFRAKYLDSYRHITEVRPHNGRWEQVKLYLYEVINRRYVIVYWP
jgi:hypothetical protein